MWDAFEHILMFISLYVLATSIALTLYFFIDKWFPGVTTESYYRSSSSNDLNLNLLRGYLAALIVSFPLFAFFFLHITKRTMLNPTIRSIKSRKILIYITLVVAFIIMLYNIISTVYNLLSGNITFNFVLHLLITLSVTGIVFVYYLYQVREDRKINV
ncbi:MAG: hypothetical protein A3B44_01900 [Candidatus Levybacteria bacterium RIFCSPLOWO2_01_FULL_38_21]|nr:MAG: hypothetical protein A3B44_01900 [Candidatus Levybacteria bacterium RIFCSPLOWO2_01_FULL_38_21]